MRCHYYARRRFTPDARFDAATLRLCAVMMPPIAADGYRRARSFYDIDYFLIPCHYCCLRLIFRYFASPAALR